MNLWNTRFPDFVLTQNNFTKIFQNYLGEIKVDKNNRLGWPNKQFSDSKKCNDENDYWKQYINDCLVFKKDEFLQWSDLKNSFKKWLSIYRKNDKPKINDMKEYFNKKIGPWVHTQKNNLPADGYRNWLFKS